MASPLVFSPESHIMSGNHIGLMTKQSHSSYRTVQQTEPIIDRSELSFSPAELVYLCWNGVSVWCSIQYPQADRFDFSYCQWLCPKSLLRMPVVADLNQQWLHLMRILADTMPEGLSVWIANIKDVVVPLLERVMQLLNVADEKTEL